jgi:ATP adenylyltransferase
MAKQNLWAPWRISYVKDVATEPGQEPSAPDQCFLCEAADPEQTEAQMRDRLVLLSDHRGTLMLNRYPYTNGHLLAAPPQHVADLSDLTDDGRTDLMALLDEGNRLLQRALNPQGVNIGLNLGRCAGAGLPGHMHFHLVPRWHGDVNFMDVLGSVRVIPQALAQSYKVLCEAMQTIE